MSHSLTSEGYVSVKTAAELLQLSEKTIRRAIAGGEIEAVRFGTRRNVRISRAELELALQPVTKETS